MLLLLQLQLHLLLLLSLSSFYPLHLQGLFLERAPEGRRRCVLCYYFCFFVFFLFLCFIVAAAFLVFSIYNDKFSAVSEVKNNSSSVNLDMDFKAKFDDN